MGQRPLVVLVTDFGSADTYVAEMKFAMRRWVPDVRVVDGTHEIPAFDRGAACLSVERLVAELPPGSAIACVVDPGVGTQRRRIAARRHGVWMVGPDNGSLPIRTELDPVWLLGDRFPSARRNVTTFDGRERFAPIAALLAAGLDPALAGERTLEFMPSVLSPDARFELVGDKRYARGVVVAIDRFGNAVTNVRAGEATGVLAVVEPAEFAGPVRRAYGEVDRGAALALIGSAGRLELARREAPSGIERGCAVVVECAS